MEQPDKPKSWIGPTLGSFQVSPSGPRTKATSTKARDTAFLRYHLVSSGTLRFHRAWLRAAPLCTFTKALASIPTNPSPPASSWHSQPGLPIILHNANKRRELPFTPNSPCRPSYLEGVTTINDGKFFILNLLLCSRIPREEVTLCVY